MTPEELDEFGFKLSALRMHGRDSEYVREIDPLLDPLVKALREARELAESNMTTIVNLNTAMHLQAVEIDSYHRKRMASVEKERDEARAEVERLRSAITRFVNQYPWQDGPEIQELKALKEEG